MPSVVAFVATIAKTACSQFFSFLKQNSRFGSYQDVLSSVRTMSDVPAEFIKEHFYESLLPEFAIYLCKLNANKFFKLGSAKNYIVQVEITLCKHYKEINFNICY